MPTSPKPNPTKMDPSPGSVLPYVLGDKQTHGTYSADTLFYNGEPVALMCGIPQQTTAEEMEAGIGKGWEPAWKRAKAIRDTLNEHAAQAAELERCRDVAREALEKADELERVSNVLNCCKDKAERDHLGTMLATAGYEYKQARAAARRVLGE